MRLLYKRKGNINFTQVPNWTSRNFSVVFSVLGTRLRIYASVVKCQFCCSLIIPILYYLVYLRVVLCEFEAWTRSLRKEHRLKAFENKVPRKTFPSKRGQGNRGMEKARYFSPNNIRVINQE